jgi:hypothetical protein
MQQWSDLLLQEVLGWPQVTTRPMFGMTAAYRSGRIFAVLPRTRAMETRYSVSFKLPRRTAKLDKILKTDAHILPFSSNAKWISFELRSGDDLPEATIWLSRAYELAGRRQL